MNAYILSKSFDKNLIFQKSKNFCIFAKPLIEVEKGIFVKSYSDSAIFADFKRTSFFDSISIPEMYLFHFHLTANNHWNILSKEKRFFHEK